MLKDKNVNFRCDVEELSKIKALPFLLEEYIPGVNFNRSSSICYAINYLFNELSDSIFDASNDLKSNYGSAEEFRKNLLQRMNDDK